MFYIALSELYRVTVKFFQIMSCVLKDIECVEIITVGVCVSEVKEAVLNRVGVNHVEIRHIYQNREAKLDICRKAKRE